MRILLTGSHGQVGYELERSLQGIGAVTAVTRKELDLTDSARIRSVIREIQPHLIVNPAAYTAVDKAESEQELAMAINGIAPGVMAEEAAKLGAAMIHYSTDYVFDGNKAAPYTEEDAPNPLNVYGRTKLAGEIAIQRQSIPYLILRTSWVYGLRGNNFLLTVRRLANERPLLRMIDDQLGAPTWSRTIADVTSTIVARSYSSQGALIQADKWSKIYHLTATGETSWFGFAKEIAMRSDIANPPVIEPIASSDYPLPAVRPKNSRLSCERLIKEFCCLPEWRAALDLCN